MEVYVYDTTPETVYAFIKYDCFANTEMRQVKD